MHYVLTAIPVLLRSLHGRKNVILFSEGFDQKALTGSAGTAAPAARTIPQVVAERLSGVSCSALLGGGLPFQWTRIVLGPRHECVTKPIETSGITTDREFCGASMGWIAAVVGKNFES